METLLAIAALFVLIAFQIAILFHLAGIRGALERIVSRTAAPGKGAAGHRRCGEESGNADPAPRAGSPAPKPAVSVPPVLPPPPPALVPPPPAVSVPEEPVRMAKWASSVWEWLRVGEAWRPGWIPGPFAVAAVQLLRAAALLLLFGAAWFVRYVHEQGWLSPAWRIAAGFAAAAALVAGGVRLARRNYRPVGLALVGLGFALGEFADWAGANLYGVLSAPAAFGVAAALALGAGFFAWRQESLFLALVAFFAGYTAPLFFPEAVRGGGDGPLLAWLLVLAAEGAALAVARGWRSLPWVCGIAGFALASPVLASGLRLDALGRGAFLAFLGVHAALSWIQSAGRALLRRGAPAAPDSAAWLASTAVTAVAASCVAAPFAPFARGLPCLALAAGCGALAAAFAGRGVRARAPFEGLGGAGGALALAFAAQSFSGSALCALSAAAALGFVAAAARWRSSVAGALVLAAWCAWLGAVGAPAGAAERLARIGSAVVSLWASGLLLLRAEPRGPRAFAPGFLWCAWFASLAWGSWEVRRAFPDAAPALALAWSAFALATLAAGLRFARRDVRGAALVLFALAAGKFLFLDQAGAPTPERVAGFFGVGLLLLLGSAGYIRASVREKKQ